MSRHDIVRSVYRAQARAGQEEGALAHFHQMAGQLSLGLDAGRLMTISLFRWGVHFFAYWESIQQTITPEQIFGGMGEFLAPWPGAEQLRTFVPMLDIFHYLAPESVEHWRRKQPIARVMGRLARLKPELASSYIFYHYQFQEEQPGRSDKYGQINLHENLMFFYQELPAIVEEPRRSGKLTTSNTPPNWQAVMFPHFILWEDAASGQEIWRAIDLVLHRMHE